MRRTRRSGRLVAAAIATTFLMVPVALAADATGCSGEATSFDTAGIPIDTAAAPGEGGTREDPLDILWAGTIEWSGSTDEVLQDGSYKVAVAPVRGGVLVEAIVGGITSRLPGFSGDVDNASGKQEASGTVSPADVTGRATFLTGTYAVDWTVTGQAGQCTGSGYVKITDNPRGSVVWWVALTLIVLGILGFASALPRTRKG
jgi:hypothetical protein